MLDRPFVLNTARLYLHELTAQEARDMHELNLDPDVIRYTGDPPFNSVDHARQFLAAYADYRKHGFGRWAVRLKQDDTFLGWCGLKRIPEISEVDLGFRFHQRYWNQGYATESALACLDHGFSTLQLEEVIGRAMPQNHASIRVLKKVGMHYWKDVVCQAHPAKCFLITREQWLQK